MKSFVLFALTLCVAHGEMSRKLFTERGQRPKSKLDQGSHHGRGFASTGRSNRQFFRKKFGHQKAIPESKPSSRNVRSVVVKEHSSGYGEYVAGNSIGLDLDFSSGYSSGSGSGSFFSMSFWLNDGIETVETPTKEKSKKMNNSPAKSPTHADRYNKRSSRGSNPDFVRKEKVESRKSNAGIISVLTPRKHQVKRSIFDFFTGSGDTSSSSGYSSDERDDILSDVQEGSGSVVPGVVTNQKVKHFQYALGHSESMGISTGSGSIACIGNVHCDQGSGSIEIQDAQMPAMEKPTNLGSEEQIHSSGMYADDHQP
ncbi:unnamed protein product [Acanthosepion pharaonis]|uniref:Uncharacterized protein n=1 Tax=Acanthosepion pharaonis TaxID=158019 RepID=A0A812E2H8_ACAPH|nr:unnamed protein product [Sepia pharaonis]